MEWDSHAAFEQSGQDASVHEVCQAIHVIVQSVTGMQLRLGALTSEGSLREIN